MGLDDEQKKIMDDWFDKYGRREPNEEEMQELMGETLATRNQLQTFASNNGNNSEAANMARKKRDCERDLVAYFLENPNAKPSDRRSIDKKLELIDNYRLPVSYVENKFPNTKKKLKEKERLERRRVETQSVALKSEPALESESELSIGSLENVERLLLSSPGNTNTHRGGESSELGSSGDYFESFFGSGLGEAASEMTPSLDSQCSFNSKKTEGLRRAEKEDSESCDLFGTVFDNALSPLSFDRFGEVPSLEDELISTPSLRSNDEFFDGGNNEDEDTESLLANALECIQRLEQEISVLRQSVTTLARSAQYRAHQEL